MPFLLSLISVSTRNVFPDLYLIAHWLCLFSSFLIDSSCHEDESQLPSKARQDLIFIPSISHTIPFAPLHSSKSKGSSGNFSVTGMEPRYSTSKNVYTVHWAIPWVIAVPLGSRLKQMYWPNPWLGQFASGQKHSGMEVERGSVSCWHLS